MDLFIPDTGFGGYVAATSQQKYTRHDEKDSSHPSSPSSSTSDDIFSVVSEASSQSSHGDLDEHAPPAEQHESVAAKLQEHCGQLHTSAPFEALPASLLQNPRRSFSSTKRIPPPLPRQEERKVLFVNDLVDSATNLVSVIWPLSSLPCGQSSGNKGVLPLRRYIEETLRRSRTSYSTLQVALYYLILIKSHVARTDVLLEQSAEGKSTRAMQCGRRMFLAALILASKYLQDRNYSAKAWSKMSGLKTTEINGNERMFLGAVNWKLHIPDHIFKRWTDIVLQFTAQPSPPSPDCGVAALDSKTVWARLIPLLTPTLDDPRILALPSKPRPQALYLSLQNAASVPTAPTTPIFTGVPPSVVSQDATPTPTTVAPRFLEPKPDVFPPTPGLVRMGLLPTPAMTPSSIGSSTPAVSACSSRRPSMSLAMSQVQHSLLSRLTQDRQPGCVPYRSSSVRSLAPSVISCSSPESMVSDLTRSSRSSSISSVSTAPTAAPHRAFARPAIYRSTSSNVTVQPSKTTKDGTADHPIRILDDSETTDLTVSPVANFSHFHLGGTPTTSNGVANTVTPLGESRKRCRSQPGLGVDTQLQSGVRSLLLVSDPSAMEAMDIDADERLAESRVPTCALRRAMASLCRSSSLKDPQATKSSCPLRRAISSYQRPVTVDETESPRKRPRFLSSQTYTPDLFMEVKDDIWQGVA